MSTLVHCGPGPGDAGLNVTVRLMHFSTNSVPPIAPYLVSLNLGSVRRESHGHRLVPALLAMPLLGDEQVEHAAVRRAWKVFDGQEGLPGGFRAGGDKLLICRWDSGSISVTNTLAEQGGGRTEEGQS